MKCHFVTDEKTGKQVLIPECWSVVNWQDIKECTCSLPIYKGESKNFKEIEIELKQYIKVLETENKKLLKLLNHD